MSFLCELEIHLDEFGKLNNKKMLSTFKNLLFHFMCCTDIMSNIQNCSDFYYFLIMYSEPLVKTILKETRKKNKLPLAPFHVFNICGYDDINTDDDDDILLCVKSWMPVLKANRNVPWIEDIIQELKKKYENNTFAEKVRLELCDFFNRFL